MQSISNKKSLDDLQLISSYRENDDKVSLGILFERYSMIVFGVCMKYLKDEDESKDAVMMIFEKLMVDLKKHNIDNFRGWLHTVAKNHCLMHLRSNSAKHQRFEEVQNYVSESMETSDEVHHQDNKEQMLNGLEAAIMHLNEQQQKCIKLFYLDEKSYEQVSSATGYSMNEVKSYIQNGKRNLRIIIEKKLKLLVIMTVAVAETVAVAGAAAVGSIVA